MNRQGVNSGGPRVFISAAEPSADMHGAMLIRAVRALRPEIQFVGVVGPNMVAEGCEPIFDMTSHAVMLLGAIRQTRRACAMLTASFRCLTERPFQAAVVIDSPVLHLPLAAIAKDARVPVLYYIAPQTWAWRESRIKKLRDRVNRLAVILPFEEAYFQERGVAASYVGHPLADIIADEPVLPASIQSIRGFGNPIIVLLPGSRRHVVGRVLPGQLEVAERILSEYPESAIVVSAANGQVAPSVHDIVGPNRRRFFVIEGRPAPLILAADLALVASGTMTLEVALRQRPMIVMYNSSRFIHRWIGRHLIKTRFLSLPNILAGRQVVAEFMPYYSSTIPISDLALALMASADARQRMVEALDEVVEPLRLPGASQKTARMLLEMIYT